MQSYLNDNGSTWQTAYDITCNTPDGQQGQLPVFLAELAYESDIAGIISTFQ